MNIGLIILVTSLFVGAEDNNNDQPAEIKKPNSERVTTNEEVVKNKISINQSDEIPQNTSGTDKSVNKKNSPPTIQGEPRVKINQEKLKMLYQFNSREITHILVNLMVILTGRVTCNS
jgi:hypothetical protein